jgi:hypothetical protein
MITPTVRNTTVGITNSVPNNCLTARANVSMNAMDVLDLLENSGALLNAQFPNAVTTVNSTNVASSILTSLQVQSHARNAARLSPNPMSAANGKNANAHVNVPMNPALTKSETPGTRKIHVFHTNASNATRSVLLIRLPSIAR